MGKKILVVCPSDKLGGAEQFLLNLVRYFSKAGYSVHVYFLLKRSNNFWESSSKVTVHYTNCSRESLGLIYLLKNLFIQRENFEYTFSSHLHVNALLSILRFFKIIKTRKLVVRESTSVFSRFKGNKLLLYRFLYLLYFNSSLDLVVCQTEEMKLQLIEGCPRFKKFNIEVIYNPIDLSKVNRDVSYVTKNEYIIAIGRLHSIKGFDKLIQAYSQSLCLQSCQLLILGEGSERTLLEKIIVDLDLTAKVVLVGQVNNVYKYINNARFGVISSVLEGFPNVLLQMYAGNCKVVMTPCCGNLEIFPNLFLTKDFTISSLVSKLDEAFLDTKEYNFDSFVSQFSIENFFIVLLNYLNND